MIRMLFVLCFLAGTVQAQGTWAERANARTAEIQGELKAAGLHQSVRVQRDRWGVAHIYASDEHDLFFAQGFVVAQDRLFQMEIWKRSGQGRLAEVLGPSAVERDINARRLKYRGDMTAEYQSYAPNALAILTAFTDGINAYIARISDPAHPRLPLEFEIAGFSPEPWRPEDCLNRMAAYAMMSNATSELAHAQAVTAVGAERADQFFDLDPKVKLLPKSGVELNGLTPKLLENIVSSDRRIPFPATDLKESNNWVIAGPLTANGAPLLANDPHRVIANPSLRYIVHLVAPGWNVIGAGEPGLPGVAVGHNENIAWGFTIFGIDQQDLYVETLDAKNPERYQTPSGWSALTERHEIIRVRGASPVETTLKFSRHGPILWQDGNRALALRWVGSEPGTAGYLGSLSLDVAKNWQDFEAAMPRWKVPTENIVYADRAGNIGEHSTGLAPVRKNFDGLLPLPGNGGFEWSGFLPNQKLPHNFNPSQGFIASANHKMIPENYPYEVGHEWASPSRFERIQEVLNEAKQAGKKLTAKDMGALQTDIASLPARRLQPLLRHAIASAAAASGELRESADLILHWNRELSVESNAAVLFEFWLKELRQAVTDKAMPAELRAGVGPLSQRHILNLLDEPPTSVFGEQSQSARDALLLDTLSRARGKLAATQGNEAAHWSWGMVHMAHFAHALDASPAASVLDPAPVQRSGDNETVQATSFDSQSFDQVAGASYREIFDLSDWDNALAINVPGQSGQPGAKHFADLVPLWGKGEFFPLKYGKAAVDAVTTDTLLLSP